MGTSFRIIVTLSEQPKENLFTASHLTVVNGTADSGFYLGAIPSIDGADADVNCRCRDGTGRDASWVSFQDHTGGCRWQLGYQAQ